MCVSVSSLSRGVDDVLGRTAVLRGLKAFSNLFAAAALIVFKLVEDLELMKSDQRKNFIIIIIIILFIIIFCF